MAKKIVSMKRHYLEDACKPASVEAAWYDEQDAADTPATLEKAIEKAAKRAMVEELVEGDAFVGVLCGISDAIYREIPITPAQWRGLRAGTMRIVAVAPEPSRDAA